MKLVSVIGSIGSRLFMLIPLLAVLTGILHLITDVFLKGVTGGSTPRLVITLSVVVVFLAYGFRSTWTTKVTRVELSTDKIPHDLKIMLVADIHVDDILPTLRLKEIKKQIELQQPDLVLIAGDLFNRPNVRQAQYFSILSGINVPIYAVEGNHDTMGNQEELSLRRIEYGSDIRFLFNESITFPEYNLQVIGIRDYGHGQPKAFSIDQVLRESDIQA